MESELIRDVVVEKTLHQRLRERFLQDKDLTLEKLLNLAESYEHSLREAAAIAAPAAAAPPTATVAKVTRTRGQGQRRQQQSATSDSDKCTNCGCTDHAARDASCPARKISCHSCGKKGHFASWCRGGSSTSTTLPQRGDKSTVKELHVLACSSETATPTRLTCTVQVTAGTTTQDVSLQVDTGATCSLFSLSRAKQLFSGVAYEPSSARLFGFGHQSLPVRGTLPVTVSHSGREAAASFYLVETPRDEAIMGMDLLTALGITLHPASHTVHTVAGPEAAPEPLPAIEGYEHRIKLKPDAVPTAFKLRRLPLSVREEVSAELKRLLEAGIVERIDASLSVGEPADRLPQEGRQHQGLCGPAWPQQPDRG